MEALIDGLRMKSNSDLNKFYKKLAMQLHPDKNLHPKANEAFQKVSSAVHSLKNKTQWEPFDQQCDSRARIALIHTDSRVHIMSIGKLTNYTGNKNCTLQVHN